MWASSIVSLSVILIITFSYVSDAKWICTPCSGQECDEPPAEICIWGDTRNSCNRKVCAKGPGERCGGPLGLLGKCGTGMMCKKDERCHHCSTMTFECFD